MIATWLGRRTFPRGPRAIDGAAGIEEPGRGGRMLCCDKNCVAHFFACATIPDRGRHAFRRLCNELRFDIDSRGCSACWQLAATALAGSSSLRGSSTSPQPPTISANIRSVYPLSDTCRRKMVSRQGPNGRDPFVAIKMLYLLEAFFEPNDFAASRCFCSTGMLAFAYSAAASDFFAAVLYSAISFRWSATI